MKAKDIVFLIGLLFMSVGANLKARVDSRAAWEVGDALASIAPFLIGAKGLPSREKEPPTPTPPTV